MYNSFSLKNQIFTDNDWFAPALGLGIFKLSCTMEGFSTVLRRVTRLDDVQ